MSSRSAITLLDILQRHGLSIAVLELWVQHCERKRTGFFGCHTVHGEIELYEACCKEKVKHLEEA